MNKDLIGRIYKQGGLDFFWNAYRKDGTILCQFETVGEEIKENSFGNIDKNPELFTRFELVSVSNPEIKYSVDLETGNFNLNGILLKNNINITGYKLKCTFWRRKAVTMNLVLSKESFKYLHYIIGWNTNIEGASIKKEYKVFADFSIEEVLLKQSRKVFARGKIADS